MMMHNLYFSADWVYEFLDDYSILDKLIDMANDLNSEIVITEMHKKTVEGLNAKEYVIRVPSEEVLETFNQRVQGSITFTPWRPVSKAYYETGSPPQRMDEMRPKLAIDVTDGLLSEAIINKNIRKEQGHSSVSDQYLTNVDDAK